MECAAFFLPKRSRHIAKPAATYRPKIGFDSHGEYIFYTEDPIEIAMAKEWRYAEDGARSFLRYFWPEIFEEDAIKLAQGLVTEKDLEEEHEKVIWTEQRNTYIRTISDPRYPYIFHICYRGFGKSTIKRGETARKLILHLTDFVLWTAHDILGAVEGTEVIRALVTSDRVKRWFGDLRPQMVEGMKGDWGESSWQVCDPETHQPYAAVAPVSEGQTVNGKNCTIGNKIARPTYISGDDSEDRRTIDNEDLRRRHRSWVNKILLKCVPNVRPQHGKRTWNVTRGRMAPFQVDFSDTPKHLDCHINRLKKHNKWHGHVFPRALPHFKDGTDEIEFFESQCIGEMDNGQIMQMYLDAQRDQEEEAFWTEDMCDTTRRTLDSFPEELWTYKDAEEDFNTSGKVVRFMITDPSETFGGCKYAAHAYAVHPERGVIYGRCRFGQHMQWEEYISALVDMAQRTNTQMVFVEGLTGKPMLKSLLENEARMRGARIQFMHLRTTTKQYVGNTDYGGSKDAAKRRRGANFSRLFRPLKDTHPNGRVCFDESFIGSELQDQMRGFPDCTEWDDLDCGGHVNQVLEELDITLDTQYMPGSKEYEERRAREEEMNAYFDGDPWDDAPRCFADCEMEVAV